MRSQVDSAREESSFDTELLNAVLIYDTENARTRAMSTLDFVAGQAGEDETFAPDLWRLDQLADPCALAAAAAAAGEADMVIVSLEQAQKVPPTLERWIHRWTACRQRRDGALVGMVPRTESLFAVSPVLEFLQETALSARMDFIYGSRSRWDME